MADEADINVKLRQRCVIEFCVKLGKSIKETLEMLRIDGTVLEHPSYSPDLAPCDFWAFPTLKRQLRGKNSHQKKS